MILSASSFVTASVSWFLESGVRRLWGFIPSFSTYFRVLDRSRADRLGKLLERYKIISFHYLPLAERSE